MVIYHLSMLEIDYNEFKLHYDKQIVEEILIQRAVETTLKMIHDKGIFDGFPNADNVLEDVLFVTRRRPDLEKLNDDVIQGFYSKI